METTIEKIRPLNEIINNFISQEGLKKTIINFNDLFYYFVTTSGDECDDEEKRNISFTYKYIKDFLIRIKSDKIGIKTTNELLYSTEIIEEFLGNDELKNLINNIDNLFFFYIVNAPSEYDDEEKINISFTYKYIKDFLLNLEPYETLRNQRINIEFNRN